MSLSPVPLKTFLSLNIEFTSQDQGDVLGISFPNSLPLEGGAASRMQLVVPLIRIRFLLHREA